MDITDLPIAKEFLADTARLHTEFCAAQPFPLLVLDGFLDETLAQGLCDEFPGIEEMPRSRDYMFGNKHELSSLDRHGACARLFHEMATAPAFASFLSEVSGYDVWVDPQFHGGGFHQGGDGSFLDLHVDFNVHPLHTEWLRTLNILIYLNPNWQADYGGNLEVTTTRDGARRSIAPLFNRAVIMATNDMTFHGYSKMTLPAGVTRKSLATYAYRQLESPVVPRTTKWAPVGAGFFKRSLARHYGWSVKAKNRLLGSGTARNR